MSGSRPTLSARVSESRWLTSKRLVIVAAITPLALFFGVLWVIPFLYTVWISLFQKPLSTHIFVGFQNYLAILSGGEFWFFLWNGVVFAVSTTVLSLVIGLLLTMAVQQKIRGRKGVRTLMIFPYLIPTVITVFFWKLILDQSLGIVNRLLLELGFIADPIAFFSSPSLAMPSIVVTSLWKYGSFAFFILLANAQAIPNMYYERAEVDGATSWQQFRDITLPQLKGAILLILLIRGIWMFNKFDIIFLTTNGGPIGLTTTLPIRVYTLFISLLQFGRAAALAMIMFLFLAVFGVAYFTVLSPIERGDT